MNCLPVPEPRQTGTTTQEKRANKLADYKKVLLDAPALLQKCGVTRRIKYYCSSLPREIRYYKYVTIISQGLSRTYIKETYPDKSSNCRKRQLSDQLH